MRWRFRPDPEWPRRREQELAVMRWITTACAVGLLIGFVVWVAPPVIIALGNGGPRALLLWLSGLFAVFVLPFQVAAAILWWSAWRGRRRRRAGRCSNCGYDRQGLESPTAPCPECGTVPPV